jgi:RNA 3'-terminal phosphate cyclase (ATP)
MGEGGGQVPRTSLSLSLVTGQPFRIEGIRAGRARPGLAAQHLRSVEAAAAVGRARIEGAVKGSKALSFAPGAVTAGTYRFDVGTAGAASLVLQTVALPLALADGVSHVRVAGGTHVPWSPSSHYLERQWAWALERLGQRVEIRLCRAGFYPRGGGELAARIVPGRGLRPVRWIEPGRLLGISGISAVANLDPSIAARQARRARERLAGLGVPVAVSVEHMDAPSPGTFLFLEAAFEQARCCATGLGERGKPAERVADEAADEIWAFVESGAAVDPHLADQLLLPLCLAQGESVFTTSRVTRHLTTNADVIRRFLPEATVEVEGSEGMPGRVRVVPPLTGARAAGDGKETRP